MRKFNTREKNIAVVCAFLIFIYVNYIGLIKPLQDKLEGLNIQVQTKQAQLTKDQQRIQKAGALGNEYEDYLARFQQSGSNEQVMSSILSEIEGVAGELNLLISDLKPNRVRASDYYNQFSVSLTIDSDFNDIMHFLYNLQNQPHSFDVEEVRFDKGPRRQSSSIKTRLILGKTLIPK